MIDVELIAVLGAFGSFAVLAVAPFIVVYAVAFIALTPVIGILLWFTLKTMRALMPRRSATIRAAPPELQRPISRADRE